MFDGNPATYKKPEPAVIPDRAYKLIEKPEHWTTDVLARDITGRRLHYANHPSSFSFCAIGAVMRVYGEDTVETRLKLAKLAASLPACSPYCYINTREASWNNNVAVASWNNNGTHQQVYEAMKACDI